MKEKQYIAIEKSFLKGRNNRTKFPKSPASVLMSLSVTNTTLVYFSWSIVDGFVA